MSFSRRLRSIARSQMQALKERLDRIDQDELEEANRLRAEAAARDELREALTEGPSLRTPEEIARGAPPQVRPAASPPSAQPQRHAAPNPLARHYRVLGLEEGADLVEVRAAYQRLVARCQPDRFPEGSEDQMAARDILARVEAAYTGLMEALDPTAGRFDKLEL